MMLMVPLLRLSLLFLNIYETYKVLKAPKPSSRTGEVSIRALSQRKRNMKGCMTVWLLWCCYTLSERMFDRVFDALIPFYREIQMFVLLFQLVTRSRGAEPIYLHLMRPFIKPYVSTLDCLLDITHMLGDFVSLLIYIPISALLEWLQAVNIISVSPGTGSGPSESIGEQRVISEEGHDSMVRTKERRYDNDKNAVPINDNFSTRKTSSTRLINSYQRGVLPKSSTINAPIIASSSKTSSSRYGDIARRPTTRGGERIFSDPSSQHKIWYPPGVSDSTSSRVRNVRGDDKRSPNLRPSEEAFKNSKATNTSELSLDKFKHKIFEIPIQGNEHSLTIEEFHISPSFPAAYPPTPISARRVASESSKARGEGVRDPGAAEFNLKALETGTKSYGISQPSSDIRGIAETVKVYDTFFGPQTNRAIEGGIVKETLSTEQGFGVSLKRLRDQISEDSSSRSTSSDFNSQPYGSLQNSKLFQAVQTAGLELLDARTPSDRRASIVDEGLARLAYEAYMRAPIHDKTQYSKRRRVPSSTASQASAPSLFSAVDSLSSAITPFSRASSMHTVQSESSSVISLTSPTEVRPPTTRPAQPARVAGQKRPLPKTAVAPATKRLKAATQIQRGESLPSVSTSKRKATRVRKVISDPASTHGLAEEAHEGGKSEAIDERIIKEKSILLQGTQIKRTRLIPKETTNMPRSNSMRRSARLLASREDRVDIGGP